MDKIEKTILTRKVLFEKSPTRIKVAFKDIDNCPYWYRRYFGEIFDVRLVSFTNDEICMVTKGECEYQLIYLCDCKVLSGI
jgi:hypothetical protein